MRGLATNGWLNRSMHRLTGSRQHTIEQMEPHLDKLIRTRGVDSARTVNFMEVMANLLMAEGRQVDALPLTEQVYKHRLETLGPEHLRTLDAEMRLACNLDDVGEPYKALPHFRHGMEGWHRIFGAADEKVRAGTIRLTRCERSVEGKN